LLSCHGARSSARITARIMAITKNYLTGNTLTIFSTLNFVSISLLAFCNIYIVNKSYNLFLKTKIYATGFMPVCLIMMLFC
jgi:hypothetical protein